MDCLVHCPYCGEPLEIWIDESGGSFQSYVEDCQVCCQPMTVSVTIEDEECSVVVSRADD